jgi:hypothetical protein
MSEPIFRCSRCEHPVTKVDKSCGIVTSFCCGAELEIIEAELESGQTTPTRRAE